MRKKAQVTLMAMLSLLGPSSCHSGISKDQIGKIIKENPKIIQEAIKADPVGFLETVQGAASDAKEAMAKKRAETEKKKFEESFEKPLEPKITDRDASLGPKDAPLVIVEYSDFQCPYCERGYKTVQDFLKKYKGKVRFIYKHLPLSFHNQAMITAQYFEAIKLQDPKKAFEFHNAIFKEQRKLKNGEKFLKKEASKLKVNMKKLASDIKSEKIKEKIEADMKEAAKFGIQGTPGFILNGVPVRGAYPISYFDMIVEELKKRGKVTL